MTYHLGLAEDTHLNVLLSHHLFEIAKDNLVAITLNHNSFRCRRTIETYRRNGQTQHRASVQSELRQILRDHRNHTRVVRTGRHLAEQHLIATDEQLHAEDTVTTQRTRNLASDLLSLSDRDVAHRLRLPRLAVVAINLVMTNGFEHGGTARVTNGEQCNLVVELNETLNDHATCTGTTTLLSNGPRALDLLLRVANTLTVTRRAHHGLNDAGRTDLLHRSLELLARCSKAIGRGGQAQLLGSQTTDTLAVHREPSGFGSGDYVVALFLQLDQSGGSNSLDFGNDVVGFLCLDNLAQAIAVEHRQHIRTMCDLHCGGISILIQRNDLDTVTLQFDGNLLAKLTRTAKQRLTTDGRESSSNFYHD